MRRPVVSASQSGPRIVNHGKWCIDRHVPPGDSILIHSFPQVQAHILDHHPRIPLHLSRANLRPFPPPPLLPRHHYRLSERSVGLSDQRRSVSISSEPIHTLPSSRLTESSAPAVTNGSGCAATLATVLSHGKPIARAVSLRKGGISQYLEIGLPFDLVASVQKPVLKVETDRRLCENCDNWVVLDKDSQGADTKWAQHKLECARTALASSHAATKRHKTDSPTYVQQPCSDPFLSGLM